VGNRNRRRTLLQSGLNPKYCSGQFLRVPKALFFHAILEEQHQIRHRRPVRPGFRYSLDPKSLIQRIVSVTCV
jgi:hypothetical protein